MPLKTRGRPPKKHHNISGLQNKSPLSTILLVASFFQLEGNQTVTEEDDALIPRSRESDRLPVRNKMRQAVKLRIQEKRQIMWRLNGMNLITRILLREWL